MKILFLVPYPTGESPSQRFRFEQYFNHLLRKGHTFKIQSFLSPNNWRIFYKKGNTLLKGSALLAGFLRRFFIMFKAPAYDFVFIHREAAPLGPPFFEFILSRMLRKKIIYDFDDAIWMTDNAQEDTLQRALKWRSKIRKISTWSYRISCGNQFLLEFARQFNASVVFNPTTLETSNMHIPRPQSTEKDSVVIGWTGSHSTLKYIESLDNVLREITHRNSAVIIRIIADQKPNFSFNSWEFIPWTKNTEIDDLAEIDIGIMPLPDDDWSKGKCGFKALQYMALEIPPVVSPVGANLEIVSDGVNGFHAATANDWIQRLQELVDDPSLRKKLGKAGRNKVIDTYSVSANSDNFLALFS